MLLYSQQNDTHNKDVQARGFLGKAYNALDACAYFGVDSDALDTAWGKAKKADKLVKLGGGFHCGMVDTGHRGKEGVYVRVQRLFMSKVPRHPTGGIHTNNTRLRHFNETECNIHMSCLPHA